MILKLGTETKIVATISPAEATNQEIDWRSADYSIATVFDGIIVAKNPGSTIITAKTSNGIIARCKVVVVVPVESIEFKKEVIDLGVGETRNLEVIIYPENATNQSIKWESSDESIVMVSSDGSIVGKKNGKATITVSSEDNYNNQEISSTLDVFVNNVINGHYFVDLGLSVKWAVMNLGAESRADYGDRFAWGVVQPDHDYTWNSYPKGYIDSKYYNKSYPNYQILEEGDDAVCSIWGSGWRMPTDLEYQELEANCSITWSNFGKTNGIVLKSRVEGYENNYIFLPAGGIGSEGTSYISYENQEGNYWTSAYGGVDVGRYIHFSSRGRSFNYYTSQCQGLLVRGVIKIKTTD